MKKLALASFLLHALLGLTAVAPVHGQLQQPDNIFDGAADFEPNQFIVGYKNSIGRDMARSQASTIRLELPKQKAIAATINSQKAEALKQNPNIEYVEYDYKRYPVGVRGSGTNSIRSSPNHRRLAEVKPYGISMVQADLLSYNSTSPKKVCIIDSGYNLGHEDLATAGVTGASDGGAGLWNQDGCGHGTHVAGTIAAIDNNNVGVIGTSPGVQLHIVRVFRGDCQWAYVSDLVAALDACRAAGANIVSMSLGGGSPSTTEQDAFNIANSAGVLSIAAAGNGGNFAYSYPASYSSVVSVAAVDSNKIIATFSQQNDQVDLAAPGVAVRSTVPTGTGREASVVVSGIAYEATEMTGSPTATATGNLFKCTGLGNPGECEGASSSICLIQRGSISFAAKVQECQNQGGLGVIIYNNAPGLFSGTLNGASTSIPSVGMSDTDGATLVNLIGTQATVSIVANAHYGYKSGTSMATPHVSGVAALVWSNYPLCSNQNIRDALQATAQDLGTFGRDNTYGYGLIQAKAASDYLSNGCGGVGITPAPVTPAPTPAPTQAPTPVLVTSPPTRAPTRAPTLAPVTSAPTPAPTRAPTRAPTPAPTCTSLGRPCTATTVCCSGTSCQRRSGRWTCR